MDEMSVNRNIFFSNSNQYSPGIHKNSHVISKPKPKVRIIHIFAQEIIQTDVAHFRSIVQELTGKHNLLPKTKKRKGIKTPEKTAPVPVMEQYGYIKVEEEDEWKNDSYINGFTEIEDYLQDLEELPLLPPSLPSTQHHLGHIQREL